MRKRCRKCRNCKRCRECKRCRRCRFIHFRMQSFNLFIETIHDDLKLIVLKIDDFLDFDVHSYRSWCSSNCWFETWLKSNIICHSIDLLKKKKNVDWFENDTNERIISNCLLKKMTSLFLIIEINCFSWTSWFVSKTSLSLSWMIEFSTSDVIEDCFSTLRRDLLKIIVDLAKDYRKQCWKRSVMTCRLELWRIQKLFWELLKKKIVKIWYDLQTLNVTNVLVVDCSRRFTKV